MRKDQKAMKEMEQGEIMAKTERRFDWKAVEGILWKLAALLLSTIMQIALKHMYIYTKVSPLEVLYWRSLTLIFFNYAFAQYCGVNVFVLPREQWVPMFYRSVSGMCGAMLLFASVKLFPLSLVSALSYLSPMMTAILSYLFLHEAISCYEVVGIVIAFMGVITIILNPFKTSASSHYPASWFWFSLPLLHPLFVAINSILLRHMGKRIHYTMSPAFLGIFTAAFTPSLGLPILSYEGTVTTYTSLVVVHLLAISVSAWLAQMAVARSLQVEKAGRVQAFDYLRVVIMLCSDFLLFDIPIHWLDLIGIAIIVCPNFAITFLKGCNVIH